MCRIGSFSCCVIYFYLAAICGAQYASGDDGVLSIGNGEDWMYVASRWSDTPDGGISGERVGDGAGLQGYSLAFYQPKAYSDLEADFTASMPTGHADVGLIVRAQDPTHFYLIHFPQGSQSFRAQHFWVALSIADGSGYLRFIKLAQVRRVASNPLGQRHKARVKVTGDRFQVWVNGHQALDARDGTYKSGRIGVAGFNRFNHGKVTVKGTQVDTGPWNHKVQQVKNWFVPFPHIRGHHKDIHVSLTPKGDLLCAFASVGKQYESDGKHYLARSKDKGRTWTVQDSPDNLRVARIDLPGDTYYYGDIHLFRDGRLVALKFGTPGGGWTESKDDGKTWSKPVTIKTDGLTKDPKHIGTSWQLELKDGTLLRFALGRHSTDSNPITKWGATHVQAFSTRSTDGGRTWSQPVNLDTSRGEMGNLDLTEATGFETDDGRIMCLIRPIYSPWMWETWSHDKGKSWGPCVRGPFPGYAPSPILKTRSGVALIATRFPGLTIHSTRDDGMTWDEGTYIDTSIWAMGSMVEVEPDRILFVYMDSWGGPARAQYFRVTPNGLMPARDMLPQQK